MDKIIITPENIHLVEFKGLTFDVQKKSAIDGKKIEYTYRVNWNGLLGKTALRQASMHQSKNEYNNTRPSEDPDVMSEAECERRKKVFLSMEGKVKEIDAVEGAERKRRVRSPMEIALLAKAEKDPMVKKALQDELKAMQDEINNALNSIK